MAVHAEEFSFSTRGEVEIVDITGEVEKIVGRAGIGTGVANCSVAGATGAITVIEYEPGLLEDFPAMLERVIPKGLDYAHHRMWHDGNGHSHVRASLIGPEVTLPVRGGRLVRGRWQQLVFVELDVKERSRTLYVTVTGE